MSVRLRVAMGQDLHKFRFLNAERDEEYLPFLAVLQLVVNQCRVRIECLAGSDNGK